MSEIPESSSTSTPEIQEDIGYEFEGKDGTPTKEGENEGEDLSAELLLLQRGAVEGEIGSVGQIVVKDDGKHTCISYWLYDTAKLSYKFFKQCRMRLKAEAKLELLGAIGMCMTLRKIVAIDLTGKELAALLTPMESILVLECIVIESLTAPEQAYAAGIKLSSRSEAVAAGGNLTESGKGLLEHEDTKSDEDQLSPTKNGVDATGNGEKFDSIEYVETICQMLGRILGTSRSMRSLTLYLWGLTVAGADHLASGLRDNKESNLTQLFLLVSALVEPNVVKHVAAIVLSAPKLSELWLREIGVLDDDDINELARALAQTQLTSLGLHSVVKGASDLLRKALTGAQSNWGITTLELKGVMKGIGEFLPKILSSNRSLKELVWDQREEGLRPDQWRSIGESLNISSSFELFRILVPWSAFRGKSMDGVEALLRGLDMKKPCVGLYLNSRLLEGDPNCPWFSSSEWRKKEAEEPLSVVGMKLHIEINLDTEGARDSTTIWADVAKALSSKDICLSSLYLQMSPRLPGPRGGEAENFLEALRDSSSLRLLTIAGGNDHNWPGGWKELIDCLHFNTSITHLRLTDCDDLVEDVFRQFMELLQVNLTLRKIRLNGTSWETDGKKALIDQALMRNAGLYSDLSAFRTHKLPFHPSKNGRLFLCGSRGAGKTRLRQTITGISGGPRLSGGRTHWGTKGREVELLKNDHGMQITIWELAGQEIFRSLQSVFLPRADHVSLFLFVFNPYNIDRCVIKSDLPKCFRTELKEWLRFIASNSIITGRMVPRVLVVFSRKDKMTNCDAEELSTESISSIVTELRKEFKTTLDIVETPSHLYQVDASKRKEVKPLTRFIIEIFRDLVENEGSVAPEVCLQMSSILAKRTKNIKSCPVWSSNKFFDFCADRLRYSRIESPESETPVGSDVVKLIASYLHNIGSIINIPSLNQIIVDPNWFTNILFELIQKSHDSQDTSLKVRYSKLDIFRSFFRNEQREFRDLDNSFLDELLIHFDLCYRVQGQYTFYIPAIARKAGTAMESVSWSYRPEIGQEFIGFRVECENPRRMAMTATLYSRFQIYIWRKLTEETDLVSCRPNYMHLHMGGREIFLEASDLDGSYIDVMVKCSKNETREIAAEGIKRLIIKKLRRFCASPRGCPGIALVVGMIRTECVKKLVPLADRNGQAIQIRQLKEEFKAHIMEHVNNMWPETWSQTGSSLLDYGHSWPAVHGYLPESFELAEKFLLDSDLRGVMKDVLQEHEQQLNMLIQTCEEMNHEMDQAQQCGSEVVTHMGKSGLPSAIGDFFPSSKRAWSRPVFSKIDSLELSHKINRPPRDHAIDPDEIITLQHQVQSSLRLFVSNVDRSIGYTAYIESREPRPETPNRPYLTFEDASFPEEDIAAMPLGTPLRLHLMCESIAGPHFIGGQPGFNLCIDEGNREWLQRIHDISVKFIYYYVKAGLHVTLGPGLSVPGLKILQATVSSAMVGSIKAERSGDMPLEEAWNRLDGLVHESRDSYVLKLSKAKDPLGERPHAWMCTLCRTRDH